MKSKNSGNVPAPLVYEGEIINARDEMLSLTDMWKAAREKHVKGGGDGAEFESRRPAEWMRSKGAKQFVEHMQLAMGISHSALIKTEAGGSKAGGATLAHWQIALAYAKYLSPAFHLWCNVVVRERMEGLGAAPRIGIDSDKAQRAFEMLEGVVRELTTVRDESRAELAAVRTELADLREERMKAPRAASGAITVVGFVPMLKYVNSLGIAQKGRGKLVQKCARNAVAFCKANRWGVQREQGDPGVWVFTHESLGAWYAANGQALILAHLSRQPFARPKSERQLRLV